jgi:lipoprotein-anchoring transpeptidase ErfK/SrfK
MVDPPQELSVDDALTVAAAFTALVHPPSRVEYAMWFRGDGYAIHDPPWRSQYGPCTQDAGTHGCVNVPRPAMDQLYAWAPVGTPVLIG